MSRIVETAVDINLATLLASLLVTTASRANVSLSTSLASVLLSLRIPPWIVLPATSSQSTHDTDLRTLKHSADLIFTFRCYLSGQFSDAECDAKNAVCKTVCSRSQDTCLSSNQTSVVAGCDEHYNQCLGSANVAPVSSIDCVKVSPLKTRPVYPC